MIRAVFDTNIWMSWELNYGESYRCVQAIEQGLVDHFHCDAMVAEFANTLRTKFGYWEDAIYALLYDYRRLSNRVLITGTFHVVNADPDDDKIVECAISAQAQYIVTKAHHLLDLNEYSGIMIIPPKQFLEIVSQSTS